MAARYWVGGTLTNWTDAAVWSTTDGGPSGAATPTAADDVYMTAASPGNCIISTTVACRSLDCTGYTHIIGGTGTINIGTTTARSDNVILVLTGAMNVPTAISFVSSYTGATQLVTWGGAGAGVKSNIVTFQGSASYRLQDTFKTTSASASALGVTGTCTLNTNGQSVNVSGTLSTGATSTLTLGASVVTATVLVMGAATINAGTSSITVQGSNQTVALGGKTLYDLALTGLGAANLTGGGTLHDLTRNAPSTNASINFASTVASALTYTINGTFTVTGTSVTQRLLINNGNLAGIGGVDAAGQATVNTAAFSFAYCDFMDIAAGGAGGSWTGTSMADMGGNSGITFDSPRTLYFRSGAGSWASITAWSLSSGGGSASTIPIAQDTIIFDNHASGGSSNASIASPPAGWVIGAINASGYTNATYTFTIFSNTNTLYFCGDITLGPKIVWAAQGNCFFYARGTRVLHANGATGFNGAAWTINHDKATSSVSLSSDLITPATSTFTLKCGNFYTNNYALTTNWLTSNDNFQGGTSTITTLGGGLTYQAGNLSSTTLNFTYTGGTITINWTGGAALGSVSFVAGTNNITFAGTAGVNISVASLTVAGGSARYVNFPGGTFTVRNGGSGWNVTGAPGAVIILQGYVGTWTLSVASGVVSSDYISISHSAATGGATFYAGPLAHSTDGGSNTGWVFTAAPLAISRTYALTQAQSLASADVVARALVLTQPQSASKGEAASRILSATQAQGAAVATAVSRVWSATQAAAVITVGAKARAFAATQGQGATVWGLVSRVRLVSQAAAVARAGARVRAFTATQGQGATVQGLVSTVRAVSQAASVGVGADKAHTFTATQAQALTMTGVHISGYVHISHTFALTQPQALGLRPDTTRTLALGQVSAVRRTGIANRTATLTQGQAMARRRTVTRTLQLGQASALARPAGVARTLRLTQGQTGRFAGRRVQVSTFVVGQASVVLVGRGARTFRVSQSQSPTVRRTVVRRLVLAQGMKLKVRLPIRRGHIIVGGLAGYLDVVKTPETAIAVTSRAGRLTVTEAT